MTIALGFLCQDGIVMGADTQLTAEGSHKGYTCKLLRHSFDECSAIVTYAGDPVFASAFNDRLSEWLGTAPAAVDRIQFRNKVVEILMGFYESDSLATEVLCGSAFPDGNQLLIRTKGAVVSEVKDASYVGVGDSSLIRYLLPLLARGGVRSTQQAALIGTYLIRAAKAYIDGCGGETDMWILRPSGALEYCSGQTPSVEQHQGMTEHFFSAVVSGLALGMDEAEFEERIAAMCQRLRDERIEMARFFRPTRLPDPR